FISLKYRFYLFLPACHKRHIACDELFSFHCKAHRALILPLLASNRDPLSLGGGKEKRRLTFCV
ncbi:MAG TPA: hypothetical protein H9839_00530, partial [Candidatus Intestinimonas stercorigallinarum]|nr:hypothetical protein [Candidatus Intestinimonas stercorigallinarum]